MTSPMTPTATECRHTFVYNAENPSKSDWCVACRKTRKEIDEERKTRAEQVKLVGSVTLDGGVTMNAGGNGGSAIRIASTAARPLPPTDARGAATTTRMHRFVTRDAPFLYGLVLGITLGYALYHVVTRKWWALAGNAVVIVFAVYAHVRSRKWPEPK